jgi:tetratricopeptide (TPR) repeat protein
MSYQVFSFKRANLIFLFTILTVKFTEHCLNPNAVYAQSYPPNPLEIQTLDPLLPSIKRELRPFERSLLRDELDKLNAQANAQLQVGNDEQAFTIWYRELRLRRALGTLEEIQALGRVGGIAWEKTRTQDVRIINNRLIVIQQETEAKKTLNPELLTAFAQAYQQIHSLNDSLDIYQKILANARTEKDKVAEEESLNTLGQLYLAKFDYADAAVVYEELLNIAQAQNNAFNEGIYLQQLANIYTQAIQPGNAVKIKERLAENYLRNKKLTLLTNLKIALGSDYQALKQPEQANQNYQEAFSLAWSLQQFGAAAEALKKLADLYKAYEQDDYALKIYQELITVEQQSYNYYGQMQAYDQMGQIYLKQKNYSQALSAFQKGLEIARFLKYDEGYFQGQIEQVNQQRSSGKL